VIPATLALTGQRSLAPGSPAIIRQAIRALIARYPSATWLAGGAVGADQIATDELLACGARVELVLPFPIAIQGARWTDAQRRTLVDQIARAAAVEVLRDTYSVAGYHERNRRLVTRADLVVAFYSGVGSGGTAATIRQARRQAVPVHVVPVP
jgi:predicted Rossmann-fold nucleotide-binding protein